MKHYIKPLMTEQSIRNSSILCASGRSISTDNGILQYTVPEGATPNTAM